MEKQELSLQEHQSRMLDILKDVHAFCVRNGIIYSLEGGTLLGAIRHKGFIPWDDDIDIIMPRDQYEIFVRKYQSADYEVVTVDTDPSYLFPYARVCDRKHSTYWASLPCSKEPTGIWIDIFAADGMPQDRQEQELFYAKCRKMRNFINSPVRKSLRHFKTTGLFRISTITFNFKLLIKKIRFVSDASRQKHTRRMIEFNKKYLDQTTSFWTTACCPVTKKLVCRPWTDFDNCRLWDFCDSKFYIVSDYDGYLKSLFGDYMQLPPPNDRVPQLKGWYIFYKLVEE